MQHSKLVYRKHKEYGVKEGHYGQLATAIMAVLDAAIGGSAAGWPSGHREAWLSLFGVLAGLATAAYADTSDSGAPSVCKPTCCSRMLALAPLAAKRGAVLAGTGTA